MPAKRTNKQNFLYWGKKVRNYRGTKQDTLNLYKKYLRLSKINPKRPIITDLLPTGTVRNINHYLERFWTLEDAQSEIQRIQGNRYLDEDVKNRSIERMKHTFSLKSDEEMARIHKLKGCNYKDPLRMAKRYNVTAEKASEIYAERTERKVKNLKETFRKMGGYKKEWSNRCIEYWLAKGYSDDDAKLKLLEGQVDTRSIKSIQQRYNCCEEEAKIFFDNVSEKGRQTFNKRPQHEKDEILLKRTTFNKKYSMASSKFFNELLISVGNLDDIEIRVDESEYFLWDYDNHKIYFYDFCIPKLNLLIEYNGIMFHPRKADTIFVTVSASLEKDTIKDGLAKRNNFDIYWFWENIDDRTEKLREYKNIIIEKYDEHKRNN